MGKIIAGKTALYSYISTKTLSDSTVTLYDVKSLNLIGNFKNMAGIFGYSPYDGIRLGKEVAELVRFFAPFVFSCFSSSSSCR